MKSFKRLFLFFAVICFVLSAASFASSLERENEKAVRRAASDESYVLKSEGDVICVYSDTSCTERMGVLSVRASELPAEDRDLLECGLLIENEEQLISLLEDYTS